jgi:YD repeat-containing protein
LAKNIFYLYLSATDKVLSEIDPAGNKTTYTYDAIGNRLSMTDPRGNCEKYTGDFTINYQYDDFNRLMKGLLPVSPGETSKPVVSLSYDTRGNLTQRVEPDGGITSYTYWPRNLVKTVTNQGSGVSYTATHYYDAAGNETETKDVKGNSTFKEYCCFSRKMTVESSLTMAEDL